MKHIFTIWMQPIYVILNNPKDRSGRLLLLIIPMMILGYFVLSQLDQRSFDIKKFVLIVEASIGTMILLGLIIWYLLLVIYSLLQNTQANTYLVPKFRWYLQVAIFIPMTVFPAVIAFTNVYLFRQKDLSLIWTSIVLTTLIFTGLFRFYKIISVLSIGFIIVFLRQIIDDQIFNAISQLHWLVIGVGAAGLNILLLHFLFKPGFQISHSRKKIKNSSTINPLISTLLFPLQKISRYQLAHNPSPTNLMRIAFFKSFHWIESVGLWTLIGAVSFSILICYSMMIGNTEQIVEFKIIVWICLPSISYKAMINGKNDLIQTRMEQALFSLTSFAPNKHQQIKNVSAYLLRQFFIIWCFNYLLTILLTSYLAQSHSFILNWRTYIHLFYLSHLPLSDCLLINYAKINQQTGVEDTKQLFFCVALFLSMAGLHYYFPSISIYWFASVVLTGTLVYLFTKWKNIKMIEVMFPVGRAI